MRSALMYEAPGRVTGQDREVPSTRQGWILAAAVAVVYLATADHAPLGSSVRYVEACREMLERGEWIVPHLGYVPYAEKPILAYWLGMLAQLVFGQGGWAIHLPSGLATLVAVLATGAAGRRLRGGNFSLIAGLALLGGVQVLGMASIFTTDPLLMAAMAVAWWCLLAWEDARAARWRWGFWAAAGIGVLIKGPVALAIAGSAWIGYACLRGGPWSARWTRAWSLRPFAGLALVAAISLPWTIALWLEDPRLVWFFYVRTNAQGFVDGRINHPGPWWYYLPVLAISLLPAGLLLVPAWVQGVVRACLRPRPQAPAAGDARLLLACATVFPLAFFSICSSKLSTYTMPLLPPLVLLGLDALWDRPRWARRLAPPALALLGAAVVIAAGAVAALATGSGWPPLAPLRALLDREGIDLAAAGWLVGGAVACGGAWIAAAATARRERWDATLPLLGAGLACLAAAVLPRLDRLLPDQDATRLVRIIHDRRSAPDDLIVLQSAVVQDYELTRALGTRPVLLGRTRELGMGHFVELRGPQVPLPASPYEVSGDDLPDHPWLTTSARLIADWNGPRRIWILCERDFAEALAGQVPVATIDRARDKLLLSNRR